MHQLAQLNIAKMRYTLDDPRFADFVNALEPVNAVADASPGFVWRLQTEEGDATGVRIYDEDDWLVNMSVWENLNALKAFVRSPDHVAVMRRRREWFDAIDEAYMVLWWVPAGHIPDVPEAQSRLDHLRAHGPTPNAFNFAKPFAPPAEVPAAAKQI